MKWIPVLIGVLLLHHTAAHAQQFSLPGNVRLSEPRDYARYEKDILNCISWLEDSPIDQEKEKKKDAKAFLFQWLAGCPYISVNITESVLPFTQSSPDMLTYFMGGWVRHSLTDRGDTSAVTGTIAGLKSVIKVYKANKSFKRDDQIDRLVVLNDKEMLEKWVADQLK